MDEYESLSHSKWDCKYHVVFIPKCRRKTIYAQLRDPAEVLFDLRDADIELFALVDFVVFEFGHSLVPIRSIFASSASMRPSSRVISFAM